jgi:hypothetical protein
MADRRRPRPSHKFLLRTCAAALAPHPDGLCELSSVASGAPNSPSGCATAFPSGQLCAERRCSSAEIMKPSQCASPIVFYTLQQFFNQPCGRAGSHCSWWCAARSRAATIGARRISFLPGRISRPGPRLCFAWGPRFAGGRHWSAKRRHLLFAYGETTISSARRASSSHSFAKRSQTNLYRSISDEAAS